MGWRAIFVFGFCLCVCRQELHAQTVSKQEPLTVPALQKLIKSIETNGDLAENAKTNAVEFLQEAISRLDISQEQLDKAEKFEKRLPSVADALQTARKKLAALPTAADPSIATVDDLDELNRIVETREKQLDDPDTGLRKQILDLEAEAALRRARPEELIGEITEVEDRLREINDEMESLASSGEPRELMQAHQMFLQARRQRADAERRALQAEANWYQSPNASDLLEVQQELAAKTLTLKVAELELLQHALGKRRGDEADLRVQQVESLVAKISATLKPIAEENLVLAKEQRDVANKLREVMQREQTITSTLDDLEKEFKRTQEMVDKVSLTDSIGLLLRQQRAKLPDPRSMKAELAHRNDAVRETRMRLFQLAIDRAALIDLDAASAKRADELSLVKNKKNAAAKIRALLVDQRQFYKGLESDYTKYFEQLIKLDNADRQLMNLTTKYAEYVDERVLWIRTGQTFDGNHLASAKPSLTWISNPKQWRPVIDAIQNDFSRRTLTWIVAAILASFWICFGPMVSGMIRHRGAVAADIGCRDLWPTLQALVCTLVLASGWPSLIWFLGWRLDHSASPVPFVHSVASGLLRSAIFIFPLNLLRIVCMRGGLAEHHFDWPLQSVNGWRHNVSWFLPVGAVLIGLIGLLETTTDEHRLDSFGRLTFMVFAVLAAAFSQFTIRRVRVGRTTENGASVMDADPWSERFWQFGPRLAVATCLGLLVLGWTGYFYTALQLTWRLQSTAWLAVGLIMVRAAIRRWITLERRRMAILQDEELKTIADAGREPTNSSHNPFLFPRWNWPDFRLNLTQIVTQMRSLLDTSLVTIAVIGLWFVWADVSPALNILDRVTLWETTVEQSVSNTDAKNGTTVLTIKRPRRVTAADLGLASLVIAMAVIAGRNIPGLVEVILLEHLAVDAGTRFAATCLVRYAIFIAGVSGAFAQIGVGWANVQWLVAAASVGLGFGLQEIFCNFVSGIILLFERPMRVGDVITIGDTTGTISRIRFRATTIVDGDRKELIVPNKEFITGKLLNWTLSDRVNRVGVKVVVSNDNDPQKIRRLLLEIASQQPQLLKEPAPTATLEEINGGLTFMLRGFLPTLEGRSSAVHDLYTVIHDRFLAEGIEMSCPSQEVFVRMERHDAHTSTPLVPHQSPPGVPIKPLPTDFSSAFRRA
jgi:potassium efflux system protein